VAKKRRSPQKLQKHEIPLKRKFLIIQAKSIREQIAEQEGCY
jgi:hypothetical protein